ncbi:jg15599 [Pararge aegeria aegeria]|uniref:Jg15599 protein n=1 Tax=Pararge aegeria aegeria TaxID=348720 RepID=A0A8S4RUU6_9NEOP|nr:jg15599 [Pararge aegeria aegeria]
MYLWFAFRCRGGWCALCAVRAVRAVRAARSAEVPEAETQAVAHRRVLSASVSCPQGAQGEPGAKGERGDPGLPVRTRIRIGARTT